MDTSKLKTFAQDARRVLLQQVEAKLSQVLAAESSARRESPAAVERLETHVKESGRDSVIDSVAYTWFNRFCALRYMDARGYTRVRIVSPSEGFTQPEILAEAKSGQFDDQLTPETVQSRVLALLNGTAPSANPQSEAYRILLVAACNSYRSILPSVFEHIADEIELLMPDDLLAAGSVLSSSVETLTEDDCKDVEILGWLYQFYISERKDEVMARKKAVPTEDIPAVTQLFTPHWIVRYLVENSLGRLWMLNRPGSRLREQMPYYIEGEAETDFLKIEKAEDIKVCDPAVGSGHMLTYAFDLLTLIYEEEGYAPTEIPALILRHNLHGLEICPRAAQLAELALVFKAREKSRRFFQPEHLVRPRIIELRDVSFEENELREYIRALGLGDLFHQPVLKLLHQFEEAKNFGSLIQPCLDERAIADLRRAIEAKDLGGQLFLRETHLKVLRVLEQAEALTQRYHVVVANPPYLGTKGMNARVKVFVKERFEDFKADLFAAFVIRSLALTKEGGRLGFMTPFVWMFLSSFEAFRRELLTNCSITALVQPEYHAFFESAFVPICAFSLARHPCSSTGTFIRLNDFYGEAIQATKTLEAISNPEATWRYDTNPRSFLSIPGAPIAYWISPKLREAFKGGVQIGEIASPRQGLATGENAVFLRLWHEVATSRIGFNLKSRTEAKATQRRWFPYNKGGEFRRWYGNQSHLINWENDGERVRSFCDEDGKQRSVIRNPDYYFLPCVSWSKIGSGFPAFRYFPAGFIFDVAGTSIYATSEAELKTLLSLTNSSVARKMLEVLSPTLNFEVGHISTLPVPEKAETLSGAALELIAMSRADWDNFETSWDFRDQPLLRPGLKGATLEASWRNWEAQSTAAIRRMQELETENNRLFIAAYGLDGELQPEVPEEQITLARADVKKDMTSFISYAVGCMMGRYSLDASGLILANAGDTVEDYRRIIAEKQAESGGNRDELSFEPDEDNVIPILDGDWFPDDITERFKKFLKVTFGEQHFDENMRFIEESLEKDVRKYFLTDFYKNHVQTYKKRPIYWLFSSPKGTFNALIYMHRYRPDTVSVVLKYLRDFQTKLQAHKQHLQSIADSADAKKADKTKALKEITQLTKDLKELEDYERKVIYPLASERREIDLDDGVKHNYPLFGEALKKIPGLDAKEDE